MTEEGLEELSRMLIKAETGTGFVKMKMTGFGRITEIEVEDNEIIKNDISMLLDLLKMCFNQIQEKRELETKEIMKRLALKYGDKDDTI